jgi:hypothetical protein
MMLKAYMRYEIPIIHSSLRGRFNLISGILGFFLVTLFSFVSTAQGEEAQSVTQYGITWTFDKPYTVGKFVTGDYWVIGPVTVVSVSPAPGPAPANEPATSGKSIYGTTMLVTDPRMRNGSMIILGRDREADKGTGFGAQGYDSRGLVYAPKLSVAFPLQLPVNQSLISSISTETYDDKGKVSTPYIMAPFSSGPSRYLNCAPTAESVMSDAAVLTCLDKIPPDDAFRPPYAGTEKPIYEVKDLHWDILPKLQPVASTPDWAKMERVFERPWLDHLDTFAIQTCFPANNQPGYGREFSRMTSMAGLMLLLDVPQEQKQKLMIEYVQLGIDLHGLGVCGRNWISEDGGFWIGRKWPILFASLMLNNESLRTFPPVDASVPVYSTLMLAPTTPAPNGFFCEDTDTFYGKGGDGQTVLGQTIFHMVPHPSFEEKPRSQFDAEDKRLDAYRTQNALSWNGEALAALLMKAKAIWNHDAYFDYVDRMMGPNPASEFPKWLLPGCTSSMDLFTQDMWNTYRKDIPDQPGGKDNLKWVWNDDKRGGHFEDNPKTQATPP